MPIILRTKPFDVDLMQLSFIEQKQVLKSIRFERSSDTILLKAVGHHDILRNY